MHRHQNINAQGVGGRPPPRPSLDVRSDPFVPSRPSGEVDGSLRPIARPATPDIKVESDQDDSTPSHRGEYEDAVDQHKLPCCGICSYRRARVCSMLRDRFRGIADDHVDYVIETAAAAALDALAKSHPGTGQVERHRFHYKTDRAVFRQHFPEPEDVFANAFEMGPGPRQTQYVRTVAAPAVPAPALAAVASDRAASGRAAGPNPPLHSAHVQQQTSIRPPRPERQRRRVRGRRGGRLLRRTPGEASLPSNLVPRHDTLQSHQAAVVEPASRAPSQAAPAGATQIMPQNQRIPRPDPSMPWSDLDRPRVPSRRVLEHPEELFPFALRHPVSHSPVRQPTLSTGPTLHPGHVPDPTAPISAVPPAQSDRRAQLVGSRADEKPLQARLHDAPPRGTKTDARSNGKDSRQQGITPRGNEVPRDCHVKEAWARRPHKRERRAAYDVIKRYQPSSQPPSIEFPKLGPESPRFEITANPCIKSEIAVLLLNIYCLVITHCGPASDELDHRHGEPVSLSDYAMPTPEVRTSRL
ncbi:hypothetical protein GGR52DRAFT_577401 [Hypoxylon sp. FL1284]|nr:hypothetical protein GGR52DRAFT_577401 [Hypoxylon sp. FL1284]